MDLNSPLRTQQIKAMKASASKGEESRQHHLDDAARHADGIRAFRLAPRRTIRTETTVCADMPEHGTFTWDAIDPASPTDSWDNEGGAINPTESPKIPETPLKLAPQLFVGSIAFTNLTLAVAEHARQKSIKA